jgi:hypothetical protein
VGEGEVAVLRHVKLLINYLLVAGGEALGAVARYFILRIWAGARRLGRVNVN